MSFGGLAVDFQMPNKPVCLSMLLVIAGWLSACVNPQQVDLVERDQRRLRADMGTLQGDVDGFRATLADTRATLQQMQRDLSAIKERIDETRVQVGRQIGQTSRDGDQRVKTLESRLAKLEEEAKAQAQLLKSREDELKQLRDAALAAEQRPIVYDGYADIALGETESVRKDYENAWRSFDKKDYQAAVGRFRDFLKKNPKTRLAAAAQFWLGESYFALKEYEKAIVAYDEVRRFPQADKVAAALLKQGIAFGELGEKLNARLVLQELVEKYPQSAEAPRAKQRLKALES
jgi:tol-pal system protein YbgF